MKHCIYQYNDTYYYFKDYTLVLRKLQDIIIDINNERVERYQ